MSQSAAGFDVYAAETKLIPSRSVRRVSLGLAVEFPVGYEMQLRGRSGLYKRGLMLANGFGTIDADYRGDIQIPLFNFSDASVQVSLYDRLAQLVLLELACRGDVEYKWADELGTTERGEGGFGSTG